MAFCERLAIAYAFSCTGEEINKLNIMVTCVVLMFKTGSWPRNKMSKTSKCLKIVTDNSSEILIKIPKHVKV